MSKGRANHLKDKYLNLQSIRPSSIHLGWSWVQNLMHVADPDEMSYNNIFSLNKCFLLLRAITKTKKTQSK